MSTIQGVSGWFADHQLPYPDATKQKLENKYGVATAKDLRLLPEDYSKGLFKRERIIIQGTRAERMMTATVILILVHLPSKALVTPAPSPL